MSLLNLVRAGGHLYVMNISRAYTSRLARLVRPVLTSVRGVVDLASIMVGGIVLGVIAAGALVTVFGVIPWTQDNAAKQDLATVTSAQAVAYAKDGHYLDVDGLVEAGYLSGAEAQAAGLTTPGGHGAGVFAAGVGQDSSLPPGAVRIQVGEGGVCYVAATASGSGIKFVLDQSMPEGVTYQPGMTLDCEGVSLETLVDESAPVITTSTLAAAATGKDYQGRISAVGSGQIGLTVTDGALPDGLVLDPDTGALSGRATTDGDYEFTVQAASDYGTDVRDYTLRVYTAPRITTVSLPDARVGDDYQARVEADGTGSVSYSVGLGGLPDGLTLDGGTGEITGTPTVDGDFEVTVVATNPGGTDTATIALRIKPIQKMVSTWDTTLIDGATITLPLHGDINATIDWGDGTGTEAAEFPSHTYTEDGQYDVTIHGTFEGWGGDSGWDATSVISIPQWSNTGTSNLSYALYHAENFTHLAEVPSGVVNMSGMFWGALSFNQPLCDEFHTSQVTDMSNMFRDAASFNQTVELNSESATNMYRMFKGAASLDMPVTLDTSHVRNMHGMFEEAALFNSEIDFTDTSQVTNMSRMFSGATNFDKPIDFDTRSVTTMKAMFSQASSFDSPVPFDTRGVTDMVSMFNEAISFDQPVSFATPSLTDTAWMFSGATSFNSDVSLSDTSSVTDMQSMFRNAAVFNKPVEFDTSASWSMTSMFYGASAFNQPLDFHTGTVRNMSSMFHNTPAFNQDLSGWDVSKVTSHTSFNLNSGLTADHLPSFPN